MVTSTEVVPLSPRVAFPEDPGLADLPKLFDSEWIWQAYCRRFGTPGTDPDRIRIRQFAHSLGRLALVSYEIEWPVDDYLPSQHLAIRVERDKPVELSRYPEDRSLPGLLQAANPESALELLNTHVLAVRARRSRVELVRYRPASRAVLRHSVGGVRFYARVMRPHAVRPLLDAHRLVAQSGFVSPRIAGYWAEGGVVWLSEIPGKNLRQRIQAGKLPEPTPILDGLQALWAETRVPAGARQFDLSRAYRRAKRSFRHNVRDGGLALRSLDDATRSLDSFVKSWHPTGVAHNDFYDDQMLVLRDGRIALVDFEEAGPGDPMLDVGNFLAHLKWAAAFGARRRTRDGNNAFHEQFKQAAIERFRWSERDLAFREAVCLFRVCTNTIRHPREDWHDRLDAGLSLVNDTLG